MTERLVGLYRQAHGMTAYRFTAVVLTLNEEENLPACLESLRGWLARMVVVDSGSTDRTREIARDQGALVLEHPFESHTGSNGIWRSRMPLRTGCGSWPGRRPVHHLIP